MKNKFKKNFKNNSGLALVEYVLLVALVGVSIIGTVTLFKDALKDKFTTIITEIKK